MLYAMHTYHFVQSNIKRAIKSVHMNWIWTYGVYYFYSIPLPIEHDTDSVMFSEPGVFDNF